MQNKIKFYVALRGNKRPHEYIELAQYIEDLGFDRIYVYDDLMFHSSSQILPLIAEHTKTIELGPCLVNGFYRHPAIIAQEAAFLEEMAPGRTVLGIGRGAFFDFYNMDDSEQHTRQGLLETGEQIKRLLKGTKAPLNGNLFEATEKAFLRIPGPERNIPLVVGSWNKKIAEMSGTLAEELQVAEVWTTDYLQELKHNFTKGGAVSEKVFNIGGMSCISYDKQKACSVAKRTGAVYIPYLDRLISKYGYDPNDVYFQEIFRLSKEGEYEECAKLISDQIIERIALVGSPESIVERILDIHKQVGIDGIMMSPPYGTGTIKENLKLIMKKVVAKVNR